MRMGLIRNYIVLFEPDFFVWTSTEASDPPFARRWIPHHTDTHTTPTMIHYTKTRFILTAMVTAIWALPLAASERRFAYTYEATTAPKGMVEYEQWFTFKDYDDKERYEFRHELEFGLTDRLQLGVYLSDWRHTEFDNGADETEWRTAGLEAIYNVTDPNKSALGSALYGEVLVGPEKFALEGKLLLQKNAGPFVFAYNLVVEAEWEGGKLSNLDEKVGVWENTFGVSYEISPNFLIGAEALHEVEFEDWSESGDHVFYVGPNVSFRTGKCFITATALFQATGVDGEPDAQVRILAGFHF